MLFCVCFVFLCALKPFFVCVIFGFKKSFREIEKIHYCHDVARISERDFKLFYDT